MLTLLFLLACDGGDASVDSGTDAAEPTGESLYGAICGNCHGIDGTGTTAPSLHDQASTLTVEEVAIIATEGKGDMYPTRATDEEAALIADYVVNELLAP